MKRRSTPSVLGHGELATSLILIFPLFLAYEVGVMFSSTINGVDFVTRWTFAAAGHSRTNFILFHLVLGVVFLAYALHLRRRRKLALDVIPPMLFESAIYALTLGTFIVFVMERLLGFAAFSMSTGDPLALGSTGEAIVISLGAGVHEELIFRLGLMAGTALLLQKLGIHHRFAVFAALGVSALVFSMAHHIGPHGEPLDWSVFTYRALAGAMFGAIFYFRSLAHAVYTHFLYDLYVLVLRA